jgi:osmotically-inducible protein OsmY
MRTDEDIKRDVEYELKWDPDIDPSDIGVAVTDGAITLSGFARSFRQRRKAEEEAERVAWLTPRRDAGRQPDHHQ